METLVIGLVLVLGMALGWITLGMYLKFGISRDNKRRRRARPGN